MLFLLITSLFLLGVLIYFLIVWRRTSGGALFLTPFIVFSIFDVCWTWPATLYAQYVGYASCIPAVFVGLGFLSFVITYSFFHSRFRLSGQGLYEYSQRKCNQSASWTANFITMVMFGSMLVGMGLYLYQGLPPIVETLKSLRIGDEHSSAVVSLTKSRESITKGSLRNLAACCGSRPDGGPIAHRQHCGVATVLPALETRSPVLL